MCSLMNLVSVWSSLASLNDRGYVLRNASLGAFVAVGTFKKKGKTVPLQAWSGPEGSRKLR